MKTANIPNTTKRRLAVYFNYAGKDIDPNNKVPRTPHNDDLVKDMMTGKIISSEELQSIDDTDLVTSYNNEDNDSISGNFDDGDIELTAQQTKSPNKIFRCFRKIFQPKNKVR